MSDAASQLRRLLILIPQCADDQPRPIAELARRLGTTPETVLKDVKALADRFDDPGAFVEAVQVFVEPDRLRVRSNHFLRPMRLTVAELAALELGLSILSRERPPDEQPAVSRARDRLDAALAKMPRDEIPDGLRHADLSATGDSPWLADLRKAYREGRKIRLRYRKADSEAVSERETCPYAIVFAAGRWYLVAGGNGNEGVRVFRVDRIDSVELLEEHYEVPDDFEVGEVFSNGRAFASAVAEKVRIRFAPRVARWIAEREGGTVAEDGSYVQELPLGDLDWVARYVLQYAGEAEVLEPAAAREAVIRRLDEIAAKLDAEAGE